MITFEYRVQAQVHTLLLTNRTRLFKPPIEITRIINCMRES